MRCLLLASFIFINGCNFYFDDCHPDDTRYSHSEIVCHTELDYHVYCERHSSRCWREPVYTEVCEEIDVCDYDDRHYH